MNISISISDSTVEADVVVVGGGGSGLAAAAAAAELGRKVVLLEKNEQLGGSTVWSVGSVSVNCSPHQLRQGIQDNPRDHLEDLRALAGSQAPLDDYTLARILTENIASTFSWLRATGLEFAGPMPEPPHRQPRMHNVLPNSRAFAWHLGRYCRRLGVDIRLGTHALELIRRNGRIAGVLAQTGDARVAFHARGGTVLAAGDYSASREMLTEFVSEDVAQVDPVNRTATGDGFRLALAQGATMVNAGIIRGPVLRFVPPGHAHWIQRIPPWRVVTGLMRWSFDNLPQALLRPFMMRFLTTALGPARELFTEDGVLINRDGRRFTDELGDVHTALARQQDRIGWIVFDQAMASRFSRWPYFVSTAPGVAYAYLDDYRRTRPDLFHRARTIAGLAERIGVPAAALASTLEAYNSDSMPDGGGVRGRGARAPISQAPFYALGPVRSYVVFTNGSLDVSLRHEVFDADGAPIPGLFAAGANGQGRMLLEGHGHHLGWAFTSGRLAGREAAFWRPNSSS